MGVNSFPPLIGQNSSPYWSKFLPLLAPEVAYFKASQAPKAIKSILIKASKAGMATPLLALLAFSSIIIVDFLDAAPPYHSARPLSTKRAHEKKEGQVFLLMS